MFTIQDRNGYKAGSVFTSANTEYRVWVVSPYFFVFGFSDDNTASNLRPDDNRHQPRKTLGVDNRTWPSIALSADRSAQVRSRLKNRKRTKTETMSDDMNTHSNPGIEDSRVSPSDRVRLIIIKNRNLAIMHRY